MITYVQAIVIGLLQGVTELFPVSSLGHSVLVPALLGWHTIVAGQSAKESFYLAFLVGLHVATALALLVFFRAEWARIVAGLASSLGRRRIETADERLAWLLVAGTIAAVFLTCNGVLLLAGERLRRRAASRSLAARLDPERLRGLAHAGTWAVPGPAAEPPQPAPSSRQLATLSVGEAVLIGSAQILAFLAGISRSGATMVAGLARGLDHEDAARFSFLLATPIILAAGVYKLPDLLGPNGDGVRGQVLAGSAAAAVAAYLSVRFLTRWFQTRTLTPFAIY